MLNDKLIKALEEINIAFPIEKEYQWKLPEDGCPIKLPNNLDSFSKNVFLKENLHKKLTANPSMDDYYWIIQKWGGIKTFKKNTKNDNKIVDFIKQLESSQLSKATFEVIPSLSKIASFMDPRKYVIYDTRVIYSLNWLIFRYANDNAFFPQPPSRNSSLLKYDMQTILRLYSGQDPHYVPRSAAYFEYCHLIAELSKRLYGKKENIYKVEMLLFAIAPRHIVNDIEKSISLTIK